MPNLTASITDLVVGDDWAITVTIPNVTTTDPLAAAWFTLKLDEADPDPGVFQVAVTTTAGAGGQITNNGGATGVATVVFLVPRATSSLVTPAEPHVFDVQVRTAAGRIHTPVKGKLIAPRGVTTATL